MDSKLKKFFSDIDYNLGFFWEEVEAKLVTKPVYQLSTNTLSLKIEINNFLPVKAIALLEEIVASKNINLDLKFVSKSQNYRLDDILEYFDYIITKILDKNSKTLACKILVKTNIDFISKSNRILIKVHNMIESENIARLILMIQARYHNYGFTAIIVNSKLIADPNKFLEEKKRILSTELEKFDTYNATKKENIKPARKTYQSGRKWNARFDQEPIRLIDINEDEPNITIKAKIFKVTTYKTRNNKMVFTFWVTDHTSSIVLTRYCNRDEEANKLSQLKTGDWIVAVGNIKFDKFKNDQVLAVTRIKKNDIQDALRNDTAQVKRAELDVHSKMSTMSGVTSVSEYIKRAGIWKYPAIAITDDLNVQCFPEAQKAQANFPDLKVIYGLTAKIIPAKPIIVINDQKRLLQNERYVVFDLETTGLAVRYNEIIEFGAAIIEDGIITDRIDILIKPKHQLPAQTEILTGINASMLQNKESIEKVLPKILEILQDSTLVAHNANFDLDFLNEVLKNNGYEKLTNPVIDTLQLSRLVVNELKYFRLGTVARKLGVSYNGDTAHRGDYDAFVLAEIFQKELTLLEQKFGVTYLDQINEIDFEKIRFKLRGSDINILAKNDAGIKTLFELISKSHTDWFYGSPKIIKSKLNENRKNLLIGSGSYFGEIFDTACLKGLDKLEEQMLFYDYITVQPPDVYQRYVDSQILSEEEIEDVIKKIIFTAKKINKPVVATSAAYYLDPEDKVFRDVYIHSKGIGGKLHPLFDRRLENNSGPNQHLRTTAEMKQSFQFLGDDQLIDEIVVNNSIKISNLCEKLKPIKTDLNAPTIDDADQKLREFCWKTARETYGTPLPEIVEARLKRELDAIIHHGFAVIYWIAHKLVLRSLDSGYLVGSRGSVGSSFAATMAQITEVNPLAPHYICKNCQYSNFDVDQNLYRCGYDLPIQKCPNCNEILTGQGHNIPFETFLGFNGEKVPDIDLNFSGDYQPIAHNQIREMFGVAHTYRAGTISTVAEKTAFGYARNYLEVIGKLANTRKAEIERLAKGCEGVKRTTGQHPGGIIIVPKKYTVDDFTPVNFPADDTSSSWKTTHFEFSAIHDTLLKLDILGHVDPTALKMLHSLTKINPREIPTQDDKVLSLFNENVNLNLIHPQYIDEKTGAIGIPEFGTSFVRKMLLDAQPKSFADLVQISGLSHGTSVWLGNAQELVRSGKLELKNLIGCRDDIMIYLLSKNIEASKSFKIMESVRKGKSMTDEEEKLLLSKGVPDWYIASCKKIKYIFPKAHATAYVLMAWRVMWYKMYYPHEYYATFFSTRCDVFDIKLILKGPQVVKTRLTDIINQLNSPLTSAKVSQRDKDLIPVLEVVIEMYARNIEFTNLNLNTSDAKNFLVTEDDGVKKILPPFSSLPGLGIAVANSIVQARKNGDFFSKEDLLKKTALTKTNLADLTELGVLTGLSEKNQLSFNFFEM
jgi:DNA polymerase-3 subunit alpha (Gram-positive type)